MSIIQQMAQSMRLPLLTVNILKKVGDGGDGYNWSTDATTVAVSLQPVSGVLRYLVGYTPVLATKACYAEPHPQLTAKKRVTINGTPYTIEHAADWNGGGIGQQTILTLQEGGAELWRPLPARRR